MPRARRPRYTRHSSVHHPDPPEQMASPSLFHHSDPLEQIASLSSVHHLDSQEMMASPSPTPDCASQPTTELSSPAHPPHEFENPCSKEPGSSFSSNPGAHPLPLDWTIDECFILSKYMYENSNDFDDTVEWWGRIVPYLPGKTVQELRLFSYLYMRDYGEMPPDPKRIHDSDKKEVTQSERDMWAAMHRKISPKVQNPEKYSPPPPSIQNILPSPEALVLQRYFDWTLEEGRKLLDLIKRTPSILTSRVGWLQLIRHFPGKKVTDIGRHLAMVKFAVVFMGSANPIQDWRRLSYSAGQDAEVSTANQQPSTSAQADDSQKASEDTVVWLRGPQDNSSTDSVPSTSGRSFSSAQPFVSKPSSSRTGRGGRRR